MPDLEREFIQNGGVDRLIKGHPQFADKLIPLEERERLRLRVLADIGAGNDVWVFAYGSLIWNPILRYAEQRTARIYGYHRAFCQWTHLGRGSPERPGLMAGLDRGGSCRGIAYRIAPDAVECETLILWNRETPLPIYVPRVLNAVTEAGGIRAIAFLANHISEYYIGPMSIDAQAEYIARAGGSLGSNAEYLFNLVQCLEERGLLNASLERLKRAVCAKLLTPDFAALHPGYGPNS